MIPILFEANETNVATHGIGDLIDCISCECEMTAEGEYELSFTYPMTGELFNELTIGRLVFVKANPWQAKQLFRIYGFEKNINGMVQINCQHISYDLANIPVKAFKTNANATCQQALDVMKNNALPITGNTIWNFTFSSDVSGAPQTEDKKFKMEAPASARAVLLDGDDSIKGCYGGDLIFDNYNIQLKSVGGEDRGVLIEYGVDLMDLNQEQNISEMVTGVLPYFSYNVQVNNEYEDRVAYGDIQYASGDFVSHRVIPLDLGSYFPDQEEGTAPSKEQLNAKAREWMAAEDGFGEPEVNLTVSYATLGQDVRLHDAVTVRFLKLGIDVKSKVTSFKYDVLNEKPIEISVGKAKESVLFSLEDASRLRKGLLPPERIKNKSITSDKYATGSVRGGGGGGGGGGALAKEGVKEENIEQYAVTASRIRNNAINHDKLLGNGEVWTVNIGNNQVAEIKCEKGIRDAIAKVWQIDALIAGTIDSAGRVSCSTLIVNSTQFVGGTFSVIDYYGHTRSVYCLRTPGD